MTNKPFLNKAISAVIVLETGKIQLMYIANTMRDKEVCRHSVFAKVLEVSVNFTIIV